MKRILLIIIGVVFCIACTENTYENREFVSIHNSVSSVNIHTIQKLQFFNDSLLTIVNHSATRGGGFWKVLTVASADYLAAATAFRASIGVAAWITAVSGGTAGPFTGVAVLTVTGAVAAGASYGAASSICAVPIPPNELSINDILTTSSVYNYLYDFESYYKVQDLNTFFLDVDDMGKVLGDIHNDILSEMLRCGDFFTRSFDPIKSERIEQVQIAVENAGITMEDIQNTYQTIFLNYENLIKLADYPTYITMIHTDGLISDEVANILQLLNEGLTYGTVDCASANNAIDYYRSVIDSSIDLDEEDRIILILTLNIAQKSISLWDEMLN